MLLHNKYSSFLLRMLTLTIVFQSTLVCGSISKRMLTITDTSSSEKIKNKYWLYYDDNGAREHGLLHHIVAHSGNPEQAIPYDVQLLINNNSSSASSPEEGAVNLLEIIDSSRAIRFAEGTSIFAPGSLYRFIPLGSVVAFISEPSVDGSEITVGIHTPELGLCIAIIVRTESGTELTRLNFQVTRRFECDLDRSVSVSEEEKEKVMELNEDKGKKEAKEQSVGTNGATDNEKDYEKDDENKSLELAEYVSELSSLDSYAQEEENHELIGHALAGDASINQDLLEMLRRVDLDDESELPNTNNHTGVAIIIDSGYCNNQHCDEPAENKLQNECLLTIPHIFHTDSRPLHQIGMDRADKLE